MNTVTASELQKNFGKYQAQAQRHAVKVTSHGRDSVVLISAEDYERYKALDSREAHHVSQASDDILEALNETLKGLDDIEPTNYPTQKF